MIPRLLCCNFLFSANQSLPRSESLITLIWSNRFPAPIHFQICTKMIKTSILLRRASAQNRIQLFEHKKSVVNCLIAMVQRLRSQASRNSICRTCVFLIILKSFWDWRLLSSREKTFTVFRIMSRLYGLTPARQYFTLFFKASPSGDANATPTVKSDPYFSPCLRVSKTLKRLRICGPIVGSSMSSFSFDGRAMSAMAIKTSRLRLTGFIFFITSSLRLTSVKQFFRSLF